MTRHGKQLNKQLILRVFQEASREAGDTWSMVLRYHVKRLTGKEPEKLLLEDPMEFRRVVCRIFTVDAWRVFEKLMIRVARRLGIDPLIMSNWFGESKDSLYDNIII